MLKKLVSFSVALASVTGAVFGAASVRVMNPSSGGTGAAVTRAGSLRAGGAATATKSVSSTTRTVASTPSGAADSGRLASLSGATGIKYSKPSLPLSASASALEALEKRVDLLTENIDDLSGHYNNISADLSETQAAVDEHTGKFDSVEADIHELQERPSLSEDNVKDIVDTKTNDLRQTVGDMYTKNQVDAKIEAIDIPETPDLSGYVTKTGLSSELGNNKEAVKNIISEEQYLKSNALSGLASESYVQAQLSGYTPTENLNFLCDNPTFATTRVEGQNKASVAIKCSGKEDLVFEIPVGSDTLCKPTVTGPSVFDESAGASNIYRIGNTCDESETEVTIRNGTSGATCGVNMERSEIHADNDPTKKLIAQKLRFTNTCTNAQIGDEITITEGTDGEPGESCLSRVTTEKCGPVAAGYEVECEKDNKTGLRITKTDCNNANPTYSYIYDGDAAEPVCAPKIGFSTASDDVKCKIITSTYQKWDANAQRCVIDDSLVAETTRVCSGDDGAPGVGINYITDVRTCADLQSETRITAGDAYYVHQDQLLYIAYDDNGTTKFPDCPDGGVPFKGLDGCSPIFETGATDESTGCYELRIQNQTMLNAGCIPYGDVIKTTVCDPVCAPVISSSNGATVGCKAIKSQSRKWDASAKQCVNDGSPTQLGDELCGATGIDGDACVNTRTVVSGEPVWKKCCTPAMGGTESCTEYDSEKNAELETQWQALQGTLQGIYTMPGDYNNGTATTKGWTDYTWNNVSFRVEDDCTFGLDRASSSNITSLQAVKLNATQTLICRFPSIYMANMTSSSLAGQTYTVGTGVPVVCISENTKYVDPDDCDINEIDGMTYCTAKGYTTVQRVDICDANFAEQIEKKYDHCELVDIDTRAADTQDADGILECIRGDATADSPSAYYRMRKVNAEVAKKLKATNKLAFDASSKATLAQTAANTASDKATEAQSMAQTAKDTADGAAADASYARARVCDSYELGVSEEDPNQQAVFCIRN